ARGRRRLFRRRDDHDQRRHLLGHRHEGLDRGSAVQDGLRDLKRGGGAPDIVPMAAPGTPPHAPPQPAAPSPPPAGSPPQRLALAHGVAEPSAEAFNPKAFVASLPTRPGAYRMLDSAGTVIYVGKARNLKARVASYFRADVVQPKVMALVQQIAGIEVTV